MPLQPQDLRGMFVRDRDGSPGRTPSRTSTLTGPPARSATSGSPPRPSACTCWCRWTGVTADEDELGEAVRVPYTRAHLMEAPPLSPGTEPTVALEGEIHSHFERTPYWDVVRARQTTPAPTPEIAAAEAADAEAGAPDATVHDARRTDLAARQTEPAPTTRIADAEVEAALARGHDPDEVRVKRWGT